MKETWDVSTMLEEHLKTILDLCDNWGRANKCNSGLDRPLIGGIVKQALELWKKIEESETPDRDAKIVRQHAEYLAELFCRRSEQ
jgi:hypothetical protein